MEEKYPCPKLTPKQWIENFWYYNKWFVLVGIVFLTLVTIATVQFFTKDDADAAILYAGATILSDDTCATAAGDSFAAGFLYGLLAGKDAAYCGKLGAALAAETVQVFGAAIPADAWTRVKQLI